MRGGDRYPVEIDLTDRSTNHVITVKIDVYDHDLSRRWLASLEDVLARGLHLEKNYCFMGFVDQARNGIYILDQINRSIQHINQSSIGYNINDHFSMEDCITDDPIGNRISGRNIKYSRFNQLHRYFEDLQGFSGHLSPYYQQADVTTRWHIRQLNLLCHEFESWALSYRKQIEAPDWQRPSQLMCWLGAPRFNLCPDDFEHFGIETINRDFGGVYLGVNKSVGKHHWEVFNDEGQNSRITELTTSGMRSQTEAAADFDIEWGRSSAEFSWQKKRLDDFRQWLINNGFDPNDPSLTIGHPKIAQVDLVASFDTNDYQQIWSQLNTHLDVRAVHTKNISCIYGYHWSDDNYAAQQIKELSK